MKDLTGKKYIKLTVLSYSHTKKYFRYWKCKCDCGNECVVREHYLTSGYTKSCGCYRKEFSLKHGETGTRFYMIWALMKARCLNKNRKDYQRYGAIGIGINEEWKEYMSFKKDMHDSYSKHCGMYGDKETTLDRIDNTKGYFKENCRWATPKEQSNNMKTNHLITYDGKTQSLALWADEIGIKYSCLFARVSRGWSLDRAFSKR